MGPPALVVAASNRRTTRASGDSPPEVQHFPRRFPRTGTTFQCKVAADIFEEVYASSRQAPETMSGDFPYITKVEMEKMTGASQSPCSASKGKVYCGRPPLSQERLLFHSYAVQIYLSRSSAHSISIPNLSAEIGSMTFPTCAAKGMPFFSLR